MCHLSVKSHDWKRYVTDTTHMLSGKGFMGRAWDLRDTLLNDPRTTKISVAPTPSVGKIDTDVAFQIQCVSVHKRHRHARHTASVRVAGGAAAAEAAAGRPVTQDALLDELHRVRPSYCLPTSLKVSATVALQNGEHKLQLPAGTLIELQPLCV